MPAALAGRLTRGAPPSTPHPEPGVPRTRHRRSPGISQGNAQGTAGQSGAGAPPLPTRGPALRAPGLRGPGPRGTNGPSTAPPGAAPRRPLFGSGSAASPTSPCPSPALPPPARAAFRRHSPPGRARSGPAAAARAPPEPDTHTHTQGEAARARLSSARPHSARHLPPLRPARPGPDARGRLRPARPRPSPRAAPTTGTGGALLGSDPSLGAALPGSRSARDDPCPGAPPHRRPGPERSTVGPAEPEKRWAAQRWHHPGETPAVSPWLLSDRKVGGKG